MKNKLSAGKLLFTFILVAAIIFLVTSCAVQTNSVVNPEELPGFWSGLLHGFISLFAFIVGLFTDCEIYAYPNTGGWYDLGFLLGVSIFFGGGGAGSRRSN